MRCTYCGTFFRQKKWRTETMTWFDTYDSFGYKTFFFYSFHVLIPTFTFINLNWIIRSHNNEWCLVYYIWLNWNYNNFFFYYLLFLCNLWLFYMLTLNTTTKLCFIVDKFRVWLKFLRKRKSENRSNSMKNIFDLDRDIDLDCKIYKKNIYSSKNLSSKIINNRLIASLQYFIQVVQFCCKWNLFHKCLRLALFYFFLLFWKMFSKCLLKVEKLYLNYC